MTSPNNQLPRGNTTRSLTDLFSGPATSPSGIQVAVPLADAERDVSETSFLIPLKGLAKASSPIPKLALSAPTDAESCKLNLGLSTWIGSFTGLLYHTVFCLAHSAALVRPHADHSSMGVLAQMAALGVCTAGASFIYQVGPHVPAVYPSSDLFLAPFLAVMASKVDAVLATHNLQNDDTIFFATFGSLVVTAMLLGGILCVLAARIKLANLGNYLPYPVLTGFFSTVGVLIWMLGFSVDSNGIPVGTVLTSGDTALVQRSFLHHLPSLVAGILMHVTARRHPFFVMFWIFVSVIVFYVVLVVSGTTLQTARDQEWFFSSADLEGAKGGNHLYGPPWPFGIWNAIWQGYVHWEAYMSALQPVLALVFLYLLRCSLHSAALKKLIPKVTRTPPPSASLRGGIYASSGRPTKRKVPLTLNYLLENGYAYSQLVSGLVGGISVAPSVGASLTLFHLRAEGMEPQFGSLLLLLFLYLSQFSVVQYIPKPAFSSLMVLAGLDMLRAWLVDSYFKTKAKIEWMVAPTLVVLALGIGFLNAVFVGVALSTFLFVASFYRVGTVRFVGNGLNLRSTVERGHPETAWLSENGDQIQILVLQNYLFFGNCQSVQHYVSTMFMEDPDAATYLPPIPKHLIIDFTLLTGMDTSAVDLFSEIITMCQQYKCQLYLAGVSGIIKGTLLYAGIKPSLERRFNWALDLESALAKAEDKLISQEFRIEEKDELESSTRRQKRSESLDLRQGDDGFLYALRKIDEQHGLNTVNELAALASYTTPLELDPGDILLRRNGLYFIEIGLMRVQSSASTIGGYASTMNTISNSCSHTTSAPTFDAPMASIGHLNARSSTLGQRAAEWKASQRGDQQHHPERSEQTFRLARIGQGWILGSIEMATHGMKRPGTHVASSHCRLHFLSADAVHRAETEEPIAAMHLYKLLAFLATKRQEVTIEQLGQFVHILNSPTPRLKGGKSGLSRLLNQTPMPQEL
eukprot:scaffold9519_cov183-Amphora_coffeaeformis.AAC.8